MKNKHIGSSFDDFLKKHCREEEREAIRTGTSEPAINIYHDHVCDVKTIAYLSKGDGEFSYGVNVNDIFILHLGVETNKLMSIEILGCEAHHVDVEATIEVFESLSKNPPVDSEKWEETFLQAIKDHGLLKKGTQTNNVQ